MKNVLLILLALISLPAAAFSQLNQISNPTTVPLHFNPAFAGSLDQHRLALSYGHQYRAIPGSYRTAYASYDQVSNRLKGAFGGEVYYEGNGITYNDIRVSATYAAKLNLGSNWTLSPALKVGYQRRRVNYSPNWGSSKPIIFIDGNRHGLNFSPGLLINSPSFYFGISSGLLGSIRLKETSEEEPPNNLRPQRDWKLQTGYHFQPKGRPWSLAATATAIRFGDLTELMGQLMYNRKWLMAGVGITRGYVVISPTILQSSSPTHVIAINGARLPVTPGTRWTLSAGFKHERFRLLGVYDYSSQPLDNSVSGGSFQLALMLYLPRGGSASSPEAPTLQ